MVALLMARICRAFECCHTEAKPRTTADTGVEVLLVGREFVYRGTRKMLRERVLTRAEHTQNEMIVGYESIGTARVVTDAP
jgi:hypothetical protein